MTVKVFFRVRGILGKPNEFEVVSGDPDDPVKFMTSRRKLQQFVDDLSKSEGATLKASNGEGAVIIKGKNIQSHKMKEYLELVLESGD